MLTGHFEPATGRPFIEAYVDIPLLKVAGFVLFLIDTGSDCTVIMPADARLLKIDYSKLKSTDTSIGSSGPSLDYLCHAIVIFAEKGVRAYSYNVELRIPESKPETMILPSLLGRDIFNRWQASFDPSKRTIIANVLSCDREFPWDNAGV